MARDNDGQDMLIAYLSYSFIGGDKSPRTVKTSGKTAHSFKIISAENGNFYVIDEARKRNIKVSKSDEGWDVEVEPNRSYLLVTMTDKENVSIYDYSRTSLYDARKLENNRIELEDIFTNGERVFQLV